MVLGELMTTGGVDTTFLRRAVCFVVQNCRREAIYFLESQVISLDNHFFQHTYDIVLDARLTFCYK